MSTENLDSGDARPRSRIPTLDGWRAVAITLVLLSHTWASEGWTGVSPPWQDLLQHGNLGVRIFFTLSGFLITHLILEETNKNGLFSLRSFYARRVLRIFPVYYLYLGVLALAQIFGFYHAEFSSWFGSLTFTRNVIGEGASATGHLWSLAIEEQFYLFWPISVALLALGRRHALAISILGVVVLSSVLARLYDCDDAGFACRFILHPNSILKYADCLAVGCLAAYARRYHCPGPKLAWLMAYGGSAALAISAQISPTSNAADSLLITFQASVAMAAMLGTATLSNSVIARILDWWPLVFLGTISYSLYVWHMLFLRHYVGPQFPLGPLANWTVWWIASICTATISYYLYERWFVQLGRSWRR